MTDLNTLHVEAKALISYGRERYEDSVTFDAASRYLLDIGSIPWAAWGTLPNSDQLSVRRGGAGVQTPYHDGPYGPTGARLAIPEENERLIATQREDLPRTRIVDEPLSLGSSTGEDLIVSGGRQTYYEGGEQDRLNEFVQRHRSTLLQLDAILQELATGHRLPLSDLIIHAWRTTPGVIYNRADLLYSVANTYAECRAELDGETKRLAAYWEGPAADAFKQYAEAATAYLTEVEAQVRWLAEEGRKAASLLEGLRNAYAAAGFDRIATLINAVTEYRERLRGLFTPCDSAEQNLIKALGDFVDFLSGTEATHMEALADLMRIEDQERRERPHLGSRNHDSVPFSKPSVGVDTWTHRDGWKVSPARPSA